MLRDFSKENFDVIIQAGQSNSEGYGYGDAQNPFKKDERILYLNPDFIICTAQERIADNAIAGNFALNFCTRYIEDGKLQPERKILIIRAAVGGTGFSDRRWGLKDDLFLRMTEMIKTALELNPKNRLICFLWHQGETDVYANLSGDTYYHYLLTLVQTVRDTFNCPALPFVAGDFVQRWKSENPETSAAISAATRRICSEIGSAAFVETDGLLSNGEILGNSDTIHFCRNALNQLGDRYYKEFCGIK